MSRDFGLYSLIFSLIIAATFIFLSFPTNVVAFVFASAMIVCDTQKNETWIIP